MTIKYHYVATPQKPIPSGFDMRTTAMEALGGQDLTGKTAVITGGYSGIGLETARVLAAAGARVVVPARTPDKAAAAVAGMKGIELECLDLSDPVSIDAFADRFNASGRSLHILVNSAGIMAPPLTRDSRGYESQFATNHLGHFQLTARLWPALQRGGTARVVSVSSGAHNFGSVDLKDPNYEHRAYDKWQAYGQSKTANALFAVELDRRASEFGIRAFSVHPGSILTELQRHLPVEEMKAMGAIDDQGRRNTSGFKTVEQGAATSVWCAVSPQLNDLGGVYCEDVDIAQLVAPSSPPGGVRPWAADLEIAHKLWQLSEKMTGVKFL